MLLLSDEQELTTRRAEELSAINAQTAEAKEWAVKGWEALTGQNEHAAEDLPNNSL